MPEGFSKPTETTDTSMLYKFIKDKYVKRLYVPKNALDPVADFFQSGSDEVEESGVDSEPVAPAVIPSGLLDFDLDGTNNAHMETSATQPVPINQHITITVKAEGEKARPNEDLLAMFEEDTKKDTQKEAAAFNVQAKQTNYMVPNKYAALDYVQPSAVNNNVYNIYNTYNMNINTGPNINYRHPPNVQAKPRKEVTYQYVKPALPKPEDNAFKNILPDDF